jgi:hypothetical protein
MDREGFIMRKEFDDIVNKNIVKWSRLNKWLATERLGKQLIKNRLRDKSFPSKL